jgi:hypothetical protein
VCIVQDVIEYPSEGFAILKDSQGTFLAFRDTDRFESLDDDPGPLIWPKSWKTERQATPVVSEYDLLFQD